MQLSKRVILNSLYKLIYIIEVFWLLIDCIGGYFLNQTGGQSLINTIIRSLILGIIFLIFLLDKKIKGRQIPFFLFALFFIITVIQYLVFKQYEINVSIIF